MSKYKTEYLKGALSRCRLNKDEVLQSEICGCFNCKKIFKPEEVKEWGEERNFLVNAVCPYCQMISVIGSASGYPVNDEEFLNEVNTLFLSDEKEKDENASELIHKFRSHHRGY